MKITFLFAMTTAAILPLIMNGMVFGAPHIEFAAAFSGALWDGITVPSGQQCKRFGGKNPSTPKLLVQGIPAEANAIVMEYSDRSFAPMDNGGHGKIGYKISPGTMEVAIPSIPGHSLKLPEPFFIIEPHKAPGWDEAGAYMPPCSGGAGNDYYVTVIAVVLAPGQTDASTELAQVVLEMGKY